MLFRPKLCVPFYEQARIDFLLRRLVDEIGFEKLSLPILEPEHEFVEAGRTKPIQKILEQIGKHLSHDVSGISINVVAEDLNVCGGGG